MFNVVDDHGKQLFGKDGRPLSFTGANAFRLATAAAYRVARTTNGSDPHSGDTFVDADEPLPNGESRWHVHRDGSITPT